MKKIILTTAVLFATVAVSMAQNTGRNFRRASKPQREMLDSAQQKTPEQRAQNQADKLKKTLGLNDQQTKAIYELNLSREQKRNAEWQEMRKKSEANRAKREEMKAKFEQVREQREAEMKAYNDELAKILNKDQMAKLDQIKATQKEKIKERMKDRFNGRKKAPQNPDSEV